MYWKVIIGTIILLFMYLYSQNYLHQVTNYHIATANIALKGKEMVFISDTHFRENTSTAMLERILLDIETINPDLIIFGGDIVHKLDNEKIFEYVKDFFSRLQKIAPTYVVFGNHDLVSGRLNDLQRVLSLSEVKVLNNEAEWLSLGDPTAGFWLIGLGIKPNQLSTAANVLSKIPPSTDFKQETKIMVAHHPEYFEDYLIHDNTRPDLILAGHTHGGQIILPIIGGLFAPGQGQYPAYDYGLFTNKIYPRSRMIVTRGIGNSRFPFRINNRPEIVLIQFE